MFWNTKPDDDYQATFNSDILGILKMLLARVDRLEAECGCVPITRRPSIQMHLEASGEVTRGQDVQ